MGFVNQQTRNVFGGPTLYVPESMAKSRCVLAAKFGVRDDLNMGKLWELLTIFTHESRTRCFDIGFSQNDMCICTWQGDSSLTRLFFRDWQLDMVWHILLCLCSSNGLLLCISLWEPPVFDVYVEPVPLSWKFLATSKLLWLWKITNIEHAIMDLDKGLDKSWKLPTEEIIWKYHSTIMCLFDNHISSMCFQSWWIETGT